MGLWFQKVLLQTSFISFYPIFKDNLQKLSLQRAASFAWVCMSSKVSDTKGAAGGSTGTFEFLKQNIMYHINSDNWKCAIGDSTPVNSLKFVCLIMVTIRR